MVHCTAQRANGGRERNCRKARMISVIRATMYKMMATIIMKTEMQVKINGKAPVLSSLQARKNTLTGFDVHSASTHSIIISIPQGGLKQRVQLRL